MESSNSPTNTYTTPTCILNVSTKAKQLSHLQLQHPDPGGNFVLEIERDERGELGRTTLEGDLQALDRLQLVVSNYIADLIAKFPLPTTTPLTEQPPQSPPTDRTVDRAPTPAPPAPPPSGLMKNLPGLRNSQDRPAPGNLPLDRTEQSGHGKISKFISFMNQHDRQNLPHSDLARSVPPNSVSSGATPAGTGSEAPQPIAPYLTGGNRSLDHQLHLGELATPESGEVQVLSAIQLFDLATVLEEYAATRVTTPTTHGGTKVHAQSLTKGGVKRVDAESTAASLSRLPNLPRISAEAVAEPTQYRRRSRSGVMSIIPWAAGAAAIVGGAALVFGSGSNDLLTSLKDSLAKVKMPDFLTFERVEEPKTVGAKPTGKKSDSAIGTTPSTSPSVTLPKPWQAQSIQPPTTPPTAAATTPAGQPTKTNSGLGTMPSSSSTTPAQTTPSGKDLNPLISGIDTVPSSTGTAKVAAGTSPTTTTKSVKTAAKPTKSSDISLSTQAIPILQDPIADLNSIQRTKQVPIPPQATPAGGGINPPAVVDPYTPKKVTNSAKPKTATNLPKIQASPNVPFITPSTTIEPKTYTPNPNLITTPQPSTENQVPTNSESTMPQVVPDRSIQATNGQVGSQAIENASLKEAQRYFQGKWKANPAQTSVLQYVLDVNPKNGLVRSVNPQGEEANNYLKQSKIVKPGQKIVSPVAGNGDQKIRVLLHPDGNVDTFIEP
jgi:hypothetical protein